MFSNKLFYSFSVAFVVSAISFGFLNLSDKNPTTAIDAAFEEPVLMKDRTDLVGAWTSGSNVIVGRYHGQAASYVNGGTGWLYFIGGDTNGSAALCSHNDRYNVNTNTWSRMAPMTTVVWYSAAATLAGSIYVVSGMQTAAFNSQTSVVQKYNISGNSWSNAAPLPTTTAMHKLVSYQDSLIYCIGGFVSQTSTGTDNVWLYNAVSNTWRAATSLPIARCGHGAAITGDTIVVVGGSTIYNGTSNTVYRGVISSSNRSLITWTSGSPYPAGPRHRINGDSWGCSGVIFGPGSPSGFNSSNDCYVYSPGLNVWTQQANVPVSTSATHVGSVKLAGGIWKYIVASGLILQAPFSIPNTQIFADTLCPPVTYNHCNNGVNKAILDFQTTYDTINVGLGSDCIVTDVNVKIDTVLHTWDADLSFYIRKGGVGVKFINRVDGNGDNFIGTVIDDAASCAIGAPGCNLAPFTGTFKPTAPATLTPFNSQPTDGAWILAITDSAGGDQGTLKAWCLVISYNCPTGGVQTVTIPSRYSLSQNYPNPFNPATKISFGLPKGENVKLAVYDILGKEVATLINEFKPAGIHNVDFNASQLASGVYFYRIEAGSFAETKKMLLVK